MDIQTAVERLDSLLPLKARQEKLPASLKAAHHKVLFTLVEQGRAPTNRELAELFGNQSVYENLHRLAADDLVVLNQDGTEVLGAYPVTMEHTPHAIIINGHTIHAMCALDAVSVAPMFSTEVKIDSVCHTSNTAINILMRDSEIIQAQPSLDIVIGIRWQTPSSIAAHSLCMEMVFFKDRDTAKPWQKDDVKNISLFSLQEAVEFGRRFFLPLTKTSAC